MDIQFGNLIIYWATTFPWCLAFWAIITQIVIMILYRMRS